MSGKIKFVATGKVEYQPPPTKESPEPEPEVLDIVEASDDPPEQVLVFNASEPPPNIVFWIHDREMIRIEEDGRFYVDGRYVTNDREVYGGFVRWMTETGLYHPEGQNENPNEET